jgi:hypothetical protein
MIASHCEELVSHVCKTGKHATVWRPRFWMMIMDSLQTDDHRRLASDRSLAAFVSDSGSSH